MEYFPADWYIALKAKLRAHSREVLPKDSEWLESVDVSGLFRA